MVPSQYGFEMKDEMKNAFLWKEAGRCGRSGVQGHLRRGRAVLLAAGSRLAQHRICLSAATFGDLSPRHSSGPGELSPTMQKIKAEQVLSRL